MIMVTNYYWYDFHRVNTVRFIKFLANGLEIAFFYKKQKVTIDSGKRSDRFCCVVLTVLFFISDLLGTADSTFSG